MIKTSAEIEDNEYEVVIDRGYDSINITVDGMGYEQEISGFKYGSYTAEITAVGMNGHTTTKSVSFSIGIPRGSPLFIGIVGGAVVVGLGSGFGIFKVVKKKHYSNLLKASK